MFTGLVQGVARVTELNANPDNCDIWLEFSSFETPIEMGESIALDGCCLTVTAIKESRLKFQAGSETLSKTTLGTFAVDRTVNFERALRLSDRLGGHLVSGHIDGVGRIIKRSDEGEWTFFYIQIDAAFTKQIVAKGSITINGVSLTVVDIVANVVSIALIPHTLANTNLGDLAVNDHVNFETDLLAKYVQRLMSP